MEGVGGDCGRRDRLWSRWVGSQRGSLVGQSVDRSGGLRVSPGAETDRRLVFATASDLGVLDGGAGDGNGSSRL